jgi:hypothetical protein
MNKNGTQSTGSSQNVFTQITGWTADTTNYPGSTVSSNALVVQSTATGRTVASSVAWTAGFSGNSIEIRVKQNGTVIGTGSTSTSSPSTVTVTGVSVTSGDTITVEVEDTSTGGSFGQPGTITSGTTTYVRCT